MSEPVTVATTSAMPSSTNDQKSLDHNPNHEIHDQVGKKRRMNFIKSDHINSSAGTSLYIADKRTPVTAMASPNGEGRVMSEINTRNYDEQVISDIWKPTELDKPSQIRSLKLPDITLPEKIYRLAYSNSGKAIVALTSTADHKLWKWLADDEEKMASLDATPILWHPTGGFTMTNDADSGTVDESTSVSVISKNDFYLLSSSGGKTTVFNLLNFKTLTMFWAPPPVATAFALYPEDNNFLAIGHDDYYVRIYDVRYEEVKYWLLGHKKSVTGLAFSSTLKVLVSSGSDAQLCVWSTERWQKLTSQSLMDLSGQILTSSTKTTTQFHQDEVHLMVVHESQLAIYKAPNLDLVKKWVPKDSSGSIVDAKYSGDSQLIYAIFNDGSLGVFNSKTLQQRCQISPMAYIPTSLWALPLVIAAHPKKPKQFALGLNDGTVYILEPLQGKNWRAAPPGKNGAGPSSRAVLDQQRRY